MTIEQRFRDRLITIGLAFLPLELAMAHVKASPRMEAMQDRWSDPYEEENGPLNSAIWYATKVLIGEWLDANMPDFPGREHFR